jgi:hypothetical protein
MFVSGAGTVSSWDLYPPMKGALRRRAAGIDFSAAGLLDTFSSWPPETRSLIEWGVSGAKKFHWDHNQRWRRLLVTQDRLNVRDAAPFCSWREFPDEPGGQSGGDGRKTDDAREANNLVAVRPIDDHAADAIGPVENQPKDGSYKAWFPTHRTRQER